MVLIAGPANARVEDVKLKMKNTGEFTKFDVLY